MLRHGLRDVESREVNPTRHRRESISGKRRIRTDGT
jgi:hypothetical protein